MPSPINSAFLHLKSGKMYGKALPVSREKIFRKSRDGFSRGKISEK
jgi:hypothetical protein